MYNRNYGGFDYVQLLGITNVIAKPKNINFNPVTDGYTRPLEAI